jgi:hypothetical protein
MNIKKLNFRTLAWAIVPALLIGFSACGDDDTPPPSTTTPTKTLNKTSLTNNTRWYNQGGTIVHIFKPNGVYGGSGQWRWVNNSDTMEIKMTSSGTFAKWKFNWNTDTEMECDFIGAGGIIAFKSTEW